MDAKTIIKTGSGVLAWGVGLMFVLFVVMVLIGSAARYAGIMPDPMPVLPGSIYDQERIAREQKWAVKRAAAVCEKLNDKPVSMLTRREIGILEGRPR